MSHSPSVAKQGIQPRIQSFIEHSRFNQFILSLILLNAVLLGMENIGQLDGAIWRNAVVT